MDLQLEGKIAIVTGASRGIGLAVAQALTREGAHVVGAARTVTDELKSSSVLSVPVDLSSPEGAQRLVEATVDQFGGIDILVNNVGAGDTNQLSLGGFLDVSDEQWSNLFDLNLFSAVWASREALPSLLERQGSLINIASINARVPSTGPVGYSEAKASLVAFSKRLSEEFGPQGVRVNTISPGPTATGLWCDPEGFGATIAAASGVAHEDFLATVPEMFGIAAGRLTEPDEVAALVTFVASARASALNGADIVIDGGTIKTS